MKEGSKRVAYLGILLFGLVSLSGDLIYEGARGIIPAYLYSLGASALIVGMVSGLGEFLGYGLRLVSGYLADVTKAYWRLTVLGYLLLVSIPLLALTNNWQIAVILILIERFAKALRSPSRDTLLSCITRSVGYGKAFGLHELMDQIGAIGGPLLIAVVLYFTGNSYYYAFLTLLLPYIMLVIFLSIAYTKLKHYTMVSLKDVKTTRQYGGVPSSLKWYVCSVMVNTMGLIHISLILYRIAPKVIPWAISMLYLTAQAVDAIAAPIAGVMFDKFGRKVLYIPFILSIIPPVLTVFGGVVNVVIAVLVFGIIYGMHESIYRATVAQITPTHVRGLGYGVFYTMYGLGFLIGGLVYGFILDANLVYLAIIYAMASQVLAIFLLKRSIS